MFLEYIKTFHLQDCLNILSDVDILGYYSINIDFLKLFETYPDVGDKVLCSPVKFLPICDIDILKLQQKILEEEEFSSHICKLQFKYLKRNVHARFFGLPVCPELHRTIFPKNIDLGCFLRVTGTVVRVTQSKMLEYQRKYVCMKCKFENLMEADFENRYILKAPTRCGNTESRCRCSTFTQVNLVSREHCRDYQEIKIQEQVNKLSIGTIPGSMWVVLENDLVDCCKPGDDVVICGTVRRRWRPPVHNKKSEVEIVLQANYIEVSNSQRSEVIAMAPDVKDCFDEFWSKYKQCPLKGRDHILSSVCPQVYGLYLVKLAVLLTVITGSNRIIENKTNSDDKHTNVRGQCHLLLVGDPGTGKSQLLKASAELTPRSVFTSGAGSTRAGLTCAALREDGEWQLEAGALVLSDGGVCCIDEITLLRDHDRTDIHEAMEQQTISVAKAGIVCKLNTRCAVVAACNPKGHYRCDEPLSANVALGTPLLSRFDLIFILIDSKSSGWDDLVSSYILFGESDDDLKKKWTIEKLQMYISLIGPRQTEMTKSANTILQCYYLMQRQSEYRDPSRTTVRMLDSLIRLSQAHCSLMYRTKVLPVDAIVAISLIDLSMQDCTLNNSVKALHTTFSKYPDYDYLCTAKQLLTRLNLNEIWKEELLYYGKLLEIDHQTLENNIDNKCSNMFSRYDVTDNNIPLSLSIVTSSYFKKNKDKKDNDKDKKDNGKDKKDNDKNKKDNDKDKKDNVNDKLAETLKKHSNLNVEKKPLVIEKRKVRNKHNKRKIVKIDNVLNNDRKKSKIYENGDIIEKNNSSSTKDILIKDNMKDKDVNSEGIMSKCQKKIKLVPNKSIKGKKTTIDKFVSKIDSVSVSVSDSVSVGVSGSVSERDSIENSKNLKEIDNNNQETKLDLRISDNKANKALDKLKMYEFKERSDLKNVSNTNCDVKNVINNNICKPTRMSSQISMFDNSDCDIDIDI